MKLRTVFVIILLSAIVLNCAKRGRPNGGPKDEDAPIMVKAVPNFNSLNFKAKEIKINFDEYIKLKDVNKQLVISPPMKYAPIIFPAGTASKYIKIKILDTLKENTTYTFNFGQSVIDNNEGNVLRNFKYVFSTGDYIDSLKVTGTVKDAFNDKVDEDISILLYEMNDTYTDSTVYKEKPLYVGNSLDSTVWEITNIKAGKYKLIALKDQNKNYQFDPKQDKIGFLEKEIIVPQDSVGNEITLFKEVLQYRLNRPSEETKNRLLFGYEGIIKDSIEIYNLLEEYPSVITYEKNKDSLNYWYKDAKVDSLLLEVRNDMYYDTITVRRRSKKVDSLTITSNGKGILHLRDTLKLTTNIPLLSVDSSKISFIDKDSANVKYTYFYDKYKNDIVFNFKKKNKHGYKLEILPNAIEDFLGNKNDTLRFNFKTKSPADYGNLYLTLQDAESYPLIIELLDTSYKVIETVYVTEPRQIEFKLLSPANYRLRAIYDTNQNRKWDAGNYLQSKQPEKVVYYNGEIELKANWDKNEVFILK